MVPPPLNLIGLPANFTNETQNAKEFAEPLAPTDPLLRFKEAVPRGGIAFNVGVVRYFTSSLFSRGPIRITFNPSLV
jgi:hypothetical protein